jgi:hypothetical protein
LSEGLIGCLVASMHELDRTSGRGRFTPDEKPHVWVLGAGQTLLPCSEQLPGATLDAAVPAVRDHHYSD